MSYKVAPLTVNPKQKSALSSKVFVSQPSAEEELLVGRLFILMEVDTARNDDFALADFIVKEMYRHYYENEQFFLRDKIANLKIDYVFESALAKLNRGIAEFIEAEKLRPRLENLNIVIGVLQKNRLLFAGVGANKAMLLYRPKSKGGETLEAYNLLDVSEKTDDPTQELSNPNKLFANVINGQIPSRGYFLFANESVMEYLSKKQLTDIVTTLPPAGAAEQLRSLLEQTEAVVPFFVLIVKNTSGEEYAAPANEPAVASSSYSGVSPLVRGGGRVSVDQLNSTQDKTEQLLTPSGMLTVKKWLNKLKPASSELKTYAQDTARKLNVSANRLNSQRRKLELGRKFADVLRVIASLMADAGRFVWSLFTDQSVRANITTGFKNSVKRTVLAGQSLADGFRNLTPKRKILLSVIGICIIAFAANLVYSGIAAQKREAKARLAEAQTSFEQKEHQLEASLLYNNTDGARQILDEMNTIIAGLQVKTEDEKKIADDLTNRYHAKLDTIYAVTRLSNPAPFVELPATGDSLTIADDTLYSANGQAKALYRIGSDKNINTQNYDGFSGKPITVLADEADVYAWDQDNLVSYAGNAFKKATIENKPDSINQAAIYNTRLYAVSSADKTIYRFNQDKKTFSFSNRQQWLRDNLDISSPVSLAINGRVYLAGDNRLVQYSGGSNEALALEATSPALEAPTAIAVSADQKSIYVLEPKNKRVVAYSADGTYISQYTSDSFDNLTAVAVDADNKNLYILNGNKIFKVEVKK